MRNFGKKKVPTEISLSVLLFLLLQVWFPPQINANVPTGDIAVNCGESGDTTFDARKWFGDVDSNRMLFSLIEPHTVEGQSSVHADARAPIPPNVAPVPFGSARLSQSQFTYSFPVVTKGPKFLRLHFYPTWYANFVPYNALFSVKAGNFSLLKDFNASLWVVHDKVIIIKEYCINVESDERLNVTFLPSKDHFDAYAFINGIEVVSMPPLLYYTDPNDREWDPTKFQIVGGGSGYQIQSDRALENLYRVNVGGNDLPPSHDTGMFRSWENDHDHLQSRERPLSTQTGFYLKNDLIYKSDPNYTAPSDVYLSARSYGQHENANYNVTWEFEADSEFSYMIRLLFCEFDPKIQKYGDRTFQIFITDALVEEQADVIKWSGGNLIPTHRDYALLNSAAPRLPSKKLVSIKLQRLPRGLIATTSYHDVILNGIEIFKISDTNNNLAGANPERPLPPPPPLPIQSSKTSSKTPIFMGAAVAVSILVLASVIATIEVFRRRRRAPDTEESPWKTKSTEGSSLPSQLCRYFTITELRAATNNFDDVFIIGVGGFGNVYKGYIDDATPVAIKRLKAGSQQGVDEFLNEIGMLLQLRHIHLVSLIGYCNDGAEMILVYDFMQRGTVREYLYGSDYPPLSWKQRLEILLGAARGLQYLHAGAKHNIIHRDVKTTNILLDEKWVAKVSDFGLSKVGPTGTSTTHVSTIVKGSLGYLDPEYYKRQRLTLKSDVYSFGVVLLEVLCARPPLLRTLDKPKVSLVDWFRKCNECGNVDQTVDPYLRDSISGESLRSYCQLALSCLHDDGNQRPSMSDVVGALEFATQLVENAQDNKFDGTQVEKKREEKPLLFVSDEGSTDVRFSSTDDSGSRVTTTSGSSEDQTLVPANVFSEIGNPRAR
ncbi:hypothetical protein RJT34_18402 [Clitoria ternatea]|uniref:Protein kinase domain-containing protein n=1 Tax=Clitoria ternatea TaxID=43366 RepID=A0AAN9JB09_CLITE